MQESQLIFLVGLPRSGTTLLQSMLTKNDSIYTYSEPWLLLPLILSMRKGGLGASPYYNGDACYEAINELIGTMRGGRADYLRAIRNMVLEVYGSCLEASGRQFYLDKTVHYWMILDEIHEVFPLSKRIFIIRNPLAVLSSLLVSWFGTNHRNLPDWAYYAIYNGPKVLAETTLRGDRHIVRYEELVNDPRRIIKSVCDYLGIKYSDDMIKYGKSVEGKFRDGIGIIKHTEPVTSSLSKWESALSMPSNYKFSMSYIDTMREHLSILGYDPDDMQKTLEERHKALPVIKRYFWWMNENSGLENKISRILHFPLLRPILPIARILWKRLP